MPRLPRRRTSRAPENRTGSPQDAAAHVANNRAQPEHMQRRSLVSEGSRRPIFSSPGAPDDLDGVPILFTKPEPKSPSSGEIGRTTLDKDLKEHRVRPSAIRSHRTPMAQLPVAGATRPPCGGRPGHPTRSSARAKPLPSRALSQGRSGGKRGDPPEVVRRVLSGTRLCRRPKWPVPNRGQDYPLCAPWHAPQLTAFL